MCRRIFLLDNKICSENVRNHRVEASKHFAAIERLFWVVTMTIFGNRKVLHNSRHNRNVAINVFEEVLGPFACHLP